MTEQTKTQKIIDAIEEGRIKMRPKWHFVFKALLGVVGAIIAGLALLYVSSLLVFTLHAPTMGVHPMGPRPVGIFVFIRSLPWFLILSSIVFLALLEWLVKKYSFGYRKPLLYSLLGILGFTVLSSLALDAFRAHDRLYRFAEEREVPIMRPIYRHFVPKDDMPLDWQMKIKAELQSNER